MMASSTNEDQLAKATDKLLNSTDPNSPVHTQNELTDEKENSNRTDSTLSDSEQTLEVKIDKLMNEIHGKGRFSLFAFSSIVLGMNATGYWFYLLSYLTLFPKYDCVWSDGLPHTEDDCIAKNICAADSAVSSYSIDWSDKYSLHNWVEPEKLNLICEPGWKIALMGSMVFVGWVITLPIIPRISDLYSRKKIFILGMWLDVALFIAIFLCKSLDLMIAITFMFGLATTIRVNVGFVYMMELMPKRLQGFYSSAYNTLEGSVLLLATLYFWFVSKHWFYFSLIGFSFAIYSGVSAFFVPESPRLLIE